jgi:hypothetical protein
MEVLPDLAFLVGEEIGDRGVLLSESDSNEARLTTDCLFKLRLGGGGRDMRRKGRWVARASGDRGKGVEEDSEPGEGKATLRGDDGIA